MLHLTPFLTAYCCALAAVFGACMASFLNCMAWRVVHGESVLRGRSHCDACGHVLGARDLVPIVSYLASGGRCRYCGAKLSSRHVWGEVIGAAVFVSLLLHYDISLRLLEAWLLASILLACSFADLEGYIIPDRFLAAGLVLFIASLFFAPAPLGVEPFVWITVTIAFGSWFSARYSIISRSRSEAFTKRDPSLLFSGRRLYAMISERIETAISSGVTAPMLRPIGVQMRSIFSRL